MKDFLISLLKTQIPGWAAFEEARRKQVRAELVAALEAMLRDVSAGDEKSLAEHGPISKRTEFFADKHLDKLLAASLPLHELGAEALTKLAAALRGGGK